jgi:hypothetical protein
MSDSEENRFLNEIVEGYAGGRMAWVDKIEEKADKSGKESKGKKAKLTKEEVWGDDIWEKEMSTSFGFHKKEEKKEEVNVKSANKALNKKKKSEEEFFETLDKMDESSPKKSPAKLIKAYL